MGVHEICQMIETMRTKALSLWLQLVELCYPFDDITYPSRTPYCVTYQTLFLLMMPIHFLCYLSTLYLMPHCTPLEIHHTLNNSLILNHWKLKLNWNFKLNFKWLKKNHVESPTNFYILLQYHKPIAWFSITAPFMAVAVYLIWVMQHLHRNWFEITYIVIKS